MGMMNETDSQSKAGWTIEYRAEAGVWLTHPDGTRFGNWDDPAVPPAVRRLARQHRGRET